MSMDLGSGELHDIVDKLDRLDAVGIEIKVVELHGHDIYLKREDKKHRIVGISNKIRPNTTMREAGLR